MDIGARLLDLRKSKNLSQEEVAYKLGVSRQTISKWETNQSSPDFDKILPLCDLYGVSTDYLLTGKMKNDKESDITKQDIRELRAKGIGISVLMYILSVAWITIAIPFLDMDPILAAGIFLAICGVATYKVVYTCIRYKNKKDVEKVNENNKVAKQINEIISLIVVIIYFIVSFTTGAWYITWVLFIVCGLCEAVVKLVFMLKEDNNEK